MQPKIFISYSHDKLSHINWVIKLATLLKNNKIEVIFDQWIKLGSNLQKFMESGLNKADRVLCICTEQYAKKSNEGQGGTGYEKRILTAELMKKFDECRIIPILRDNPHKALPNFLLDLKYIDFNENQYYKEKVKELLHDILSKTSNPQFSSDESNLQSASSTKITPYSELYVSPTFNGDIKFDYSNNNGRYIVGADDRIFETAWSRGSNNAIHVYNDPNSIRSVALAVGISNISDITDATIYDISSRIRTPKLGEIVVWQNMSSYYMATKVKKIKSRNHGYSFDEVEFSYSIAHNKSTSFMNK